MENLPSCPVCGLENTYQDGDNFICPDCGHEWPVVETSDANNTEGDTDKPIVDSNGNLLADGDAALDAAVRTFEREVLESLANTFVDGVLSRNRRNFRHPSSSPATSSSRSIILPSLWKV